MRRLISHARRAGVAGIPGRPRFRTEGDRARVFPKRDSDLSQGEPDDGRRRMRMDEGAQADPLIGRTVADGRYQVLARLGTGGMGTVYRVRQHPLERLAALKLIHRELAFDATAVGRFEREMRVTAALEH